MNFSPYKGQTRLTAWLLGLSLLVVSLGAARAEEVAPETAEPALQPVLVLRTAPLKGLIEEIASLAQKLGGHDTSGWVGSVGANLGDPELASLDAGTPLSLFVFPSPPGTVRWALVAKMTEDSPIPQALAERLVAGRYEGFTFLTDKPEVLDVLPAEELVLWAASELEVDVELTVATGALRSGAQKVVPMLLMLGRMGAMEQIDKSDPAAMEQATVMFDLLQRFLPAAMHVLFSPETVVLGYNIDGDTLELTQTIVPEAGSALAKAVDAELPTSAPGAAFLPAAGFTQGIYLLNVDAIYAYGDSLLAEVQPILTPEDHQMLADFWSKVSALRSFGGAQHYAYTQALSGLKVQQTGVFSFSGKPEAYLAALRQVLSTQWSFPGVKFETSAADVEAAGLIGNALQLTSKVELDPAVYGEATAATSGKFQELMTSSMVFGVVPGYCLVAGSVEELEALATLASAGSVEQSVAEVLPIAEGQVQLVALDLAAMLRSYFESMVEMMAKDETDLASSKELLATALGGWSPPPVVAQMSVSDGAMHTFVGLDLVGLYEGYMRMSAMVATKSVEAGEGASIDVPPELREGEEAAPKPLKAPRP